MNRDGGTTCPKDGHGWSPVYKVSAQSTKRSPERERAGWAHHLSRAREEVSHSSQSPTLPRPSSPATAGEAADSKGPKAIKRDAWAGASGGVSLAQISLKGAMELYTGLCVHYGGLRFGPADEIGAEICLEWRDGLLGLELF